ncbi:MAG: phosphoribosylanthranilate isomerase [Bryobacteraceae bacterium]
MKSMSEIDFIVKICGITEEEDGEVALEAGANALGFNFYPQSPRYVTPARARQLTDALGSTYLRVGVFVNPTEAELKAAMVAVQLDVLQLHGEACATPPLGARVWRSLALPAVIAADEGAEAFLLDSPSPQFGGSGRTFDWSLAASFPRRAILAGGLDALNVADAIRAARPWGVDACSRLEQKPGRKDGSRVRAFVAAALREAPTSTPAETTT